MSQQYVNQAGFAQALDIEPQGAHHRLIHGLMPVPDVYVGQVVLAGKAVPGWSARRVRLYKEFTAPYLTGSSNRLRLPAGLELPDWWDVQPEWFLNQREAAKTLGLEAISVSARLGRSTFPVAPRVVVGEKFHGIAQGWDLQDLLTYGKQDVYLDDEGRVADKGRQGPPRKAVNPLYYQLRAQARQGSTKQARAA